MPGHSQSTARPRNSAVARCVRAARVPTLAAALLVLFGSGSARGQITPPPTVPVGLEEPAPSDPNGDAPLIPPNVEGPPVRAPNGTYCYVGPHPVDTRVVAGGSWDPTTARHYRPYPPIDARLFALRDGCYYFTGDPRDFGFAGKTYAYYGAHPVLDVYGGGWCFMMGPHTHLWAPWSPSFIVVGSWYYWHGPFDPYFWAYWPYYSFYFRSYYPGYYGGGRFYRGGGWRVAPPIHSVPAQAWRGGAARGAPVYRGAAPTQALRAPGSASVARTYAGQGIRPVAPTVRPGYAAPVRSFAPIQRAGGSGIHRR